MKPCKSSSPIHTNILTVACHTRDRARVVDSEGGSPEKVLRDLLNEVAKSIAISTENAIITDGERATEVRHRQRGSPGEGGLCHTHDSMS